MVFFKNCSEAAPSRSSGLPSLAIFVGPLWSCCSIFCYLCLKRSCCYL